MKYLLVLSTLENWVKIRWFKFSSLHIELKDYKVKYNL